MLMTLSTAPVGRGRDGLFWSALTLLRRGVRAVARRMRRRHVRLMEPLQPHDHADAHASRKLWSPQSHRYLR